MSKTIKDMNSNSNNVTIDGNVVLGTIYIDKISIKYPIIKYINDHSLNISITHYFGVNLNSVGNVVLAGHRGRNGLFFADINKLKKGDQAKIIDSNGQELTYVVTNFKVIDDDDLSILAPHYAKKKELTLISCAENSNYRYIVKLVAKEK